MVGKEFKEGDKVIKVRAYSEKKYCFYGGDNWEVPIGTKGEVISIPNTEELEVQFENGVGWCVHPLELDLDLNQTPKIFIFRK